MTLIKKDRDLLKEILGHLQAGFKCQCPTCKGAANHLYTRLLFRRSTLMEPLDLSLQGIVE